MQPFPDESVSGFSCAAPDARASLLIVHGLAEYAQRYAAAAEVLRARGVSCFAFDQIGHGERAGPRTHVDRFDALVAEVSGAMRRLREREPQIPLFLWGHSMGSIVTALAVAQSPTTCAGVITTSNSLEVFRRGPNPLNPIFRIASWLTPRVRIPLGLDAQKISSDPAVQKAYAADPKIHGAASLRLIVEFAKACERCRELAPRLTTPWLVVHGEADEIAPALGAQVLFDRLASADKKLVIYPGLRHEVHNEAAGAREAFIELLLEWILTRARA